MIIFGDSSAITFKRLPN